MILEIIGYIGSALVVISMLMSSIVKLRVINTIGSVISAVYAIICGAFPLALMNFCLIIINLVNLFRLFRTRKPYELVQASPEDGLVQYFLGYYKDDIRTFFPDYTEERGAGDTAVMVCREGNPVGILLGHPEGDAFDVLIDYSTPAYRDCSVGKYLYPRLRELNISTLLYSGTITEAHASYLQKMGYQESNGTWSCRV